MNRRFQQYTVCTEILPTVYTPVEYKNKLKIAIQTNRGAKKPRYLPFP